MEKKFTRAMVCSALEHKCKECPLHYCNNSTALHCWELTNDNVNTIMKDYPYSDVKVRMVFNDIETRLTAVEEKVENNVSVEFKPERVVFGCSYNRDIGFSAEVVDQKLYDKLEAKHEADCRLISEYDLEIKKLENEIGVLNKQIDSFGLTCRLYKKETEDLKSDVESWAKRYEHLRDMDKKRLFDLKNVENERDHYKGLYSSKCDDYDRLLEKQLKTEKELKHAEEERDHYKSLYDTTCDNYEKLYEENNKLIKENKTFNVLLINKTETIGKLGAEYDKLKEQNDKLLKDYKLLSESNNNHATDNIELEGKLEEKSLRIASLESKLRNQRANLTSLQEKYEDAVKMNKAREDVYYANIKLQKTIEAKDREIGLLRAELDKYKTDDESDDRWID